ncbi:hypothetical protein L486_03538 [Kwoniella mangroviensis CBS 10435]|uniref:CNNM transmembrane domain-containing protein n=1 Tax=Kwoniella mangroviensis CBS 10435 TaxID=1331196 RepID=A0A1B9IU64_9TREE|nr:hypothetical protein L486_03538 [Kwoniella mangroviensis CBS 10435]OCF76705.1 hypothetical protein I204_02406 [Kwoniella mangroviensis CBS 8886]
MVSITSSHHLKNVTFNHPPVQTEPHVHVDPHSTLFLWYILIIVGLVLLGGVFSGLTLGLMGLDTVNLQVLAISGTPEERKQAPRVLNLIGKGKHTMLVVLLLGNTLINTSLPIFLDSIVGGGLIAVLGSTLLIVTICDRYGLAIGSTFTPVIKILIILMYPIAKPIGMILDYILGKHSDPVTYRKAELKTFVSLGVEDKLNEDELGLLGSVLEFSNKKVGDVMTAREDMYTLSSDKIVDEELVSEILKKGYSRIPVCNEKSLMELILLGFSLRSLVSYDPTDLHPASRLVSQVLPQCSPDLPLLEGDFQTGRSHMLLITETPGEGGRILGLVTLEDVVEELIGKEIIDETDVYVDTHSRIPVIRSAYKPRKTKGLKKIYEGQLTRKRVSRSFASRRSASTGYRYGSVDEGSRLVDQIDQSGEGAV